MENKKRILVTGGAGFVGSHLCERLQKDGHEVVSLDNYSTGSKNNHIDGVIYTEGHTKDITDLVSGKFDLIYHLGEYARVHTSLDEPETALDFNVVGTLSVLEFWRKQSCKLVYTASSTKNDAVSKSADGTLGKDIAPYTWSKASNVDLINNYARWFSLPYAITYFFNVYGPRERTWENRGTVVETFRQNVLKGLPHKVNAPGNQTRAFTHVLDTVEALYLVGEQGDGDGYNICSSDVCSIADLAALFGGEVEMCPQTKTSRSSVASDTTKLKELGWEQRYTLKEYIKESIDN